MADFLTAAEAARRLGVKPATLYAYVSRGVLTRARAADGRASLFSADEVDRLARKGRPRRAAGTLEITVESAITELTATAERLKRELTDMTRQRDAYRDACERQGIVLPPEIKNLEERAEAGADD